MTKAIIAGVLRALIGPLVPVFSKYGWDISWIADPELIGLLVGFIAAAYSIKNKVKIKQDEKAITPQPFN